MEKTYHRTATRTNFNPPPGQSALAVLKRSTFTTTKKCQEAWRKLLVVVGMLPSGEIREKFQVYMSLTEETSSVDEVQRLLKQQLGFEVILLDANTSSMDEISSVSDKVHLELFSNFARRRHVHHMSDFCLVSRPLFGGGKGRSFLNGHRTLSRRGEVEICLCGRPLVRKRYPKPCTLYRRHYWANWVGSHSFSVDWVRLLKVLDVLKASMGEFFPLLWRKCT